MKSFPFPFPYLSKQNSGVSPSGEVKSQKSEWAKRPATANRMNFVRLADSVASRTRASRLLTPEFRLLNSKFFFNPMPNLVDFQASYEL